MARYAFTYASVPESEGRMMDELTSAVEGEGLSAGLRQAVLVAVSEAFTNALTHGNRYDPLKRIWIELSVNDSQVIADIKDQGRGGLAGIDRQQPPDQLSESGRGMGLIRHYSDRVELMETSSGGLHVHIEFDRKNEKVIST